MVQNDGVMRLGFRAGAEMKGAWGWGACTNDLGRWDGIRIGPSIAAGWRLGWVEIRREIRRELRGVGTGNRCRIEDGVGIRVTGEAGDGWRLEAGDG